MDITSNSFYSYMNLPLTVFYIRINENLAEIIGFLQNSGLKFQDEQVDSTYKYVLVNNTKTDSGSIKSKHFWLTDIDRDDYFSVYSLQDLKVSLLNTSNKRTLGQKFSSDKAPIDKVLKQFPLALEAVALRSKLGHEKYKEFDADWMNFKRVPDAINQYSGAAIRHFAGIGEDESDYLEHLKASAWNILATLQLTLEQQDD